MLDGKAAAAEVRAEVARGVAALKERGIPVRLDVVLVGEDPASVTYVSSKERDSAEVGIDSRVHRFPADVSQDELAELVERAELGPCGLRVLYPVAAAGAPRRRSP